MELAGVSIGIWAVFVGLILGFLVLDLGVFHRRAHEIKLREALTWTAVWIVASLLFAGLIFRYWNWIQPQSETSSADAAMAFLSGYLVEWTLSVDNIFVFLVVFAYFRVPPMYQHRVLFWGIIGALIFRAVFIALGAIVLHAFAWTMVIFGLFLIATGVKLVWAHGKAIDPGNNPIVRLVRRFIPTTEEYHGSRFFIRKEGVLFATPLFVALLVVEFSDILFAVDSVPAIYAITLEPFIVFTSNVFAILGLRSLFFAVAGLMQMFRYLHFGLAAILVFVGGKMLYGYVEKTLAPDWPKFPVSLSLLVIVGILGLAILASAIQPAPDSIEEAPEPVSS